MIIYIAVLRFIKWRYLTSSFVISCTQSIHTLPDDFVQVWSANCMPFYGLSFYLHHSGGSSTCIMLAEARSWNQFTGVKCSYIFHFVTLFILRNALILLFAELNFFLRTHLSLREGFVRSVHLVSISMYQALDKLFSVYVYLVKPVHGV